MTVSQQWQRGQGTKEKNSLYGLAIVVFIVLGYAAVRAYLALAHFVTIAAAEQVTLLGHSMTRRVAACVVAGLLGGSLSALLSAGDRLAHGLESWAGEKHPDVDPPDKFSLRMVPSFLLRPVLGASMGFVVYVGIVGGFLFATQDSQAADFSLEGLAFYGTLAGLFAKTLLEKLKIMLKALVGVTE
jgi:hypothetical protein